MPDASFYLWLPVPGGDDEAFTARLHREHDVLVLPGSYLGRTTRNGWAVDPATAADAGPGSALGTPPARNPGKGFVRIALVAPHETCVEGARRIARVLAMTLA